jgi:ERCC4-type nuclease
MRELGDIRVWRTADEEETAAYIAEEHQWWQKPWDQHRTDRTIYTPEPKVRGVGHKPRMFRREATLLEHWLHALPRIDDRATELSEYFISAGDMATAPVERWLAIKGIGDKTAQEIVGRINRAEGRL